MSNKLAAFALVTMLATGPLVAGGEIYGTVVTTSGERLEGPIRWDTNENYWNDVLDARKPEWVDPSEGDEDDGFRFSLFGWEIINSSRAQAGSRSISIPFGHIRSIEPLSGSEALLILKNGDEIEARSNNTDLGSGMRELVIEDAEEGRQEISWWRMKRSRSTFSAGRK